MDIATLGTSQVSGEKQMSATMHYHLKDVQYAVIGDNTTINIVQQKGNFKFKFLSLRLHVASEHFLKCLYRDQGFIFL